MRFFFSSIFATFSTAPPSAHWMMGMGVRTPGFSPRTTRDFENGSPSSDSSQASLSNSKERSDNLPELTCLRSPRKSHESHHPPEVPPPRLRAYVPPALLECDSRFTYGGGGTHAHFSDCYSRKNEYYCSTLGTHNPTRYRGRGARGTMGYVQLTFNLTQ